MSFGIRWNQNMVKRKIVLYGYRQFYCIHNIYKDFAEDVKTRFDTSNYELEGPLPKEKNKKVNH